MNIDRICEIIGIAAIVSVIVLFVSMFCTSCKVQDCIPETIVLDSIRVEQRLDSIYLYEKDSIFIKEKADTVFVNKYVTRYKDVLKIERDTVWQENKVVEVKIEKYIPQAVKGLAGLGVFAIVWVLVQLGLWAYRKLVLKV